MPRRLAAPADRPALRVGTSFSPCRSPRDRAPLSTHPAGARIQAYCAIIACLPIHLRTGGQPTLRTFEMLGLDLQGWATLEEVMAHLEKLKAKSREPLRGG